MVKLGSGLRFFDSQSASKLYLISRESNYPQCVTLRCKVFALRHASTRTSVRDPLPGGRSRKLKVVSIPGHSGLRLEESKA